MCAVFRDKFADDFQKKRKDRSKAAGERDSLIKDLSVVRQEISEVKSKLAAAEKEVANFKHMTEDLSIGCVTFF